MWKCIAAGCDNATGHYLPFCQTHETRRWQYCAKQWCVRWISRGDAFCTRHGGREDYEGGSHQERTAAATQHLCECPGCTHPAAAGGRYCIDESQSISHSRETFPNRRCNVRDCPGDISVSWFCRPHGSLWCRYTGNLREFLDTRLSTVPQQRQPSLGHVRLQARVVESALDVLRIPTVITSSGLPAGIEPRAVETAMREQTADLSVLDDPAANPHPKAPDAGDPRPRCVAGACMFPRRPGGALCAAHKLTEDRRTHERLAVRTETQERGGRRHDDRGMPRS